MTEQVRKSGGSTSSGSANPSCSNVVRSAIGKIVLVTPERTASDSLESVSVSATTFGDDPRSVPASCLIAMCALSRASRRPV